MYMYTYIYSQKLSPTFLWVSKFDVKLGSGGKIFKITIFTWFFKNHAKSKVFQKHKRQQPFFELFVRFEQNFDIFRNFVYRDFFCKIDPFLIFFSKILRFSDFRLKGFLLKKKLSFRYIPTISLRGSSDKHLNTRAKPEFDGTGWTGNKSVL